MSDDGPATPATAEPAESGSGGSLTDEEGMAAAASSLGQASSGAAAAWSIGAGLALGNGTGLAARAGMPTLTTPITLTVATASPSPLEESVGPGQVSAPPAEATNAALPATAEPRPAAALASAGTLDASNVDAAGEQAGLPPEAQAAAQEPTAPRPSDLLTEFLPFDRASVEAAIDQFLGQFEGLTVSLPDLSDPGAVVPGLAAVAIATAAASMVARRRRKAAGQAHASDDTEALLERFTSLSGLWKLRVT
jgi:hypothetical protein